MVFNNFINRTITSFILLFIFSFLIIFYDSYIKYLTYLIYLIIFIEILIFFRSNFLIFILSLIYLFFSLFSLNFYFNSYYIKEEFLFVILLVIIFDITSYIFGSKFGKLKILPAISPNKTFFGFFSGVLCTIFLGFLINYFFKFITIEFMFYYILVILISAFLGDIIESFLKRKSNLKNSSKLLPGHGGFFDRFDSIIMVFISLFLIKSFY